MLSEKSVCFEALTKFSPTFLTELNLGLRTNQFNRVEPGNFFIASWILVLPPIYPSNKLQELSSKTNLVLLIEHRYVALWWTGEESSM